MAKSKPIRCDGQRAGQLCKSYLGEVVGGRVRIYCRTCKTHHELYITDLVEELMAYLDDARPETNQYLDAIAGRRRG